MRNKQVPKFWVQDMVDHMEMDSGNKGLESQTNYPHKWSDL